MSKSGIIKTESSTLLLIDIQERLMPVIDKREMVFANANKLIEGAGILKLPLLVTEQYPNGLGSTCPEIVLPESAKTISKMCFSLMHSGEIVRQLKETNTRSLIVAGVEAHICVLKTVLDALDKGFEVHVIADAVSSRTAFNRETALVRMRQSGAFISTTEMILFQLIDEAGTETFKKISKLIK